jgi:hypothetical protein
MATGRYMYLLSFCLHGFTYMYLYVVKRSCENLIGTYMRYKNSKRWKMMELRKRTTRTFMSSRIFCSFLGGRMCTVCTHYAALQWSTSWPIAIRELFYLYILHITQKPVQLRGRHHLNRLDTFRRRQHPHLLRLRYISKVSCYDLRILPTLCPTLT